MEKNEKMTTESKTQTDEIKKNQETMKNKNTQTMTFTEEGKEKISNIEDINTFEEWQQIAKEEWADLVYKNTKITEGHPLDDTNSTKTIWINAKEVEQNTGLYKLALDIYPELENINGDFEKITKIIKMKYKEKEQDIWAKLEKLKKETKEDKHITIHKIKNIDTNTLRKEGKNRAQHEQKETKTDKGIPTLSS
ncbi:hypothetical protein FQR65_LT09500 [Abscondita terminalis]|nr:hypothetical protein FQR65_LT09500 [Abscondita terminalis]